MLTAEGPSAISWLEELGVEFTRENGGYRLAKCGGASAKRLLQVGDRTGHAITTALRTAVEAGTITLFPKSPLAELERSEHGWRARAGEHTLDAKTEDGGTYDPFATDSRAESGERGNVAICEASTASRSAFVIA